MAFVKCSCAIVTRLLFILISVRVWRLTEKDYKWFSPAILHFLIIIIPSIWILELHHQENKSSGPQVQKTEMERSRTAPCSVLFTNSSTVCLIDWILALHQVLLIPLIIGKWLHPLGSGVMWDKLFQLLLIFVGTAADILEFTSEMLSDINILQEYSDPSCFPRYIWNHQLFLELTAWPNSAIGGEGHWSGR
uniref:Uncharacterized protein n=1 Tax=Oncorhynchus tshawytscha TaxID=74940 RepID=A0A8C8H4D5_ONCTS